MAVLSVEQVSIGYPGIQVLTDVSLSLEESQVLSLIGPNGAGKSSLLRAISGAIPLTRGRLVYAGQDITKWSMNRRALAGIGQSYQTTSLFPDLTVFQNVLIAAEAKAPLGFAALFSRVCAATRKLAESSLAQVGLTDHETQPAHSLSHGDKRKLELAMLLCLRPRVLLLDEPTAGMGIAEVPMILHLIEQLKATGEYSIILVEHKLDVVMRLSDTVAVLHQGGLLAEGSPKDVMANPMVEEAYLGGRYEPAT